MGPIHRKIQNQQIINSFCLVVFLGSSFISAQSTGSATAKGSCIVANTGANSKINQTCTPVDPELFKEFKVVTEITKNNRKLLSEALALIRALSEQIKQAANGTSNTQTFQDCQQSVCIAGNNSGSPTVNNYKEPPPVTIDHSVLFLRKLVTGESGSPVYRSAICIALSGFVPEITVTAAAPSLNHISMGRVNEMNMSSGGNIQNGKGSTTVKGLSGNNITIADTNNSEGVRFYFYCVGVKCIVTPPTPQEASGQVVQQMESCPGN